MYRNHSTRYVMTASSNPTPSVGHQSNLTEVPRTSPARVIHFCEAGHRLLTDSERIAQKSGMDRQIKEPAIRRARAEDLAEAFEQGGYWLMWAVVLGGLAFGIFGL
jgi:hypothetical protein